MQIIDSLNSTELIKLIASGAVGCMPTDTVYGLVCNANDKTACSKLYALKNRHHNPGTLIAASFEQLTGLGIKMRYLKAVEQFWPGPVSVIIPSPQELDYIALDRHSIALRIPKDTSVFNLLRQVGPLLTSSANSPGKPTANNLEEARDYFGENVDFYVNGGDFSNHVASTVIRVIDDSIQVLREGAVKISESGEIVS